jgi:predicted metal-dependent peptidase
MSKNIALLEKARPIAVKEEILTSKQESLWDQSRAKLMWEAPGFTHILYSLMGGTAKTPQAVFTKEVPIAATDGVYMLLNPDTWFKYKLGERVFIMAHEVCHAMLNHAVTFNIYRNRKEVKFSDGTVMPYDEMTMQKAADYIINAMLVESKIGTKPPDALHDTTLVTHMDQLVEAYRKVYKAQPPQKGGGQGQQGTPGGSGSGNPSGSFDNVLKPGTVEGKNATQAAQERNEGEWKTAAAAAMEANRTQGKLSASMQRMFGSILEPQISWQEHIDGFFKRRTGSGSWHFRKPDRRLIARMPDRIYAPSRQGYGAENVVLAIDTSGSIGSKTIDLFLAEALGIIEDVQPHKLWLMWCDAKVHRVDECEEYSDILHVRAKGAVGGGGTSFVPVFEEVHKLGFKPDALVYLTDGYGTFPDKAVDYPVLWGDISHQPKLYPWGEVVNIPKVQ